MAIKTGGEVQLRSQENEDLRAAHPEIVEAFSTVLDETVVGGVILDRAWKPSFKTLQYDGAVTVASFYIFDVLILCGRDVMNEPLLKRRALIEEHLLPGLSQPLWYSLPLNATLDISIEAVKARGFGSIVAKRTSSSYQPGTQSDAWQRMSVS